MSYINYKNTVFIIENSPFRPYLDSVMLYICPFNKFYINYKILFSIHLFLH